MSDQQTSVFQYGYLENVSGANDPRCEQLKEQNNKVMSDYYLNNFWNLPNTKNPRQYPNAMGNKAGMVQDRLVEPVQRGVDTESAILLGKKGNQLTSYPCKSSKQLSTPVFPVTPDMSQYQIAMVNPDLLSNLWTGYETRTKKSVGPLAGVSIDRFIPMVPCLEQNVQNVQHIIPEYWVRGGMDTRSVIRNIDYLQACGLKNVREAKKILGGYNSY
jgi:hypothetical protein